MWESNQLCAPNRRMTAESWPPTGLARLLSASTPTMRYADTCFEKAWFSITAEFSAGSPINLEGPGQAYTFMAVDNAVDQLD